MSTLRVVFFLILPITLIGCKSSEPTTKPSVARSYKFSGISELHDKLSDIKLTKPFKETGKREEVLRALFLRSELKTIGLKEVHFRYINATLDGDDASVEELTVADLECYVLAGMPVNELLSDLLMRCGLHLESFHDGILVINTWGRPQYVED